MKRKKALRRAMIKKRILVGVFTVVSVCLLIVFSIEESREFIIGFFLRLFFFVKKHFIKFLVTFFLVNGKFIFMMFLKKIALLSVVGLGKRYMIEKVIMGHMKLHFLDHISKDLKLFFKHIKQNFTEFTIVKKIISLLAIFTSLGFVTKFMGGMLAFKVFLAKLWSFLLALFLKVGGTVIYFFSDYIWGSWLQPLLEIVIFSWFFALLERVPFLEKWLKKSYAFFLEIFEVVEEYLDIIIHKPLKKILGWLVKKIQHFIYKFIGYKQLSAHKRLLRMRQDTLNIREKILKRRERARLEKEEDKTYISLREKLLKKRKERRRVAFKNYQKNSSSYNRNNQNNE